MGAVNLARKLATFPGHWQPRVVAQFNEHDVLVAKVKGEFTWHRHDDTDDFFLVLAGRLVIELRDGGMGGWSSDRASSTSSRRESSTGRWRGRKSTCC